MEDLNIAPEKKPKRNLSILTSVLALLIITVISVTAAKNIEQFKKSFLGALSTASVTVGNVAPVASSASLNGESDINLTEGTTKAVVVTGTVTDDNGCLDLASVVVKVYKG